MNKETVTGKIDQAAGAIKQKVGETFNDQSLANAGVADQVKGAAKETWGKAKDVASERREDVAARTEADRDNLRAREENTADRARERIVDTAQKVKDKVNEKLDNLRDSRRDI